MVTGFKFLAWINGLGILAVMACTVDIIQIDLDSSWLRMPLLAFLAGLALCALGLLWTYPTQASLLAQAYAERARRGHWIPVFCVMVSYSLSLLAFVVGCWFFQGIASFTY